MQSFPLYAVGVGPGDADLLTVKAARLLREAEVIVAPAGTGATAGLAESIVKDLLDPDRQEILRRTFPMTRNSSRLEPVWRSIAAELAGLVEGGRKTVFLTLGDPLFYSTFIYLQEELDQNWPGLEVEIVPGITSFTAAAAAARTPLVRGAGRLAVVGGDLDPADLSALLEDFEMVVVLKVAKQFAALREALRDQGRLAKAVYVRRVGQAGQMIETDLDRVQPADLDYFSLLLVRS